MTKQKQEVLKLRVAQVVLAALCVAIVISLCFLAGRFFDWDDGGTAWTNEDERSAADRSTSSENAGTEEETTKTIGAVSTPEETSWEEITSETETTETAAEEETTTEEETTEAEPVQTASFFDADGMTLDTRIRTPEGYTRAAVEPGSMGEFLRTYRLKPHGSPVLLYNGEQKADQSIHAALFDLPLEAFDGQQCADSVMRMYAEYFLASGSPERIGFYLTTGDYISYEKWREGYRLQIQGDQINWIKSKEYDDSYQTFTEYMKMIFLYANTYSMDLYEAAPISLEELQIGDVLLQWNPPNDDSGHCILIVDMCYNAEGKKAFLLAQGHMPAQTFEIANNFLHNGDPWYYEEEFKFPYMITSYTFFEGCLQRLRY